MYGIYENGQVIARFAAPLTVRSNSPIFVSDTLSLSRYTSKRSAQRWEIETNVVPMSTGAQDLMVNLVTKGSSEILQAIMPQNYGVKLTRVKGSGIPLATGTKGSSQASVVDFVGFLPKGTFVRFANHSKVYMLTSALTNSGTINVFPALRAALTSAQMYFWDDVILSCRFDTSVVKGMVYTDGILMDPGTITLLEAV
jgi:hypothetical protein